MRITGWTEAVLRAQPARVIRAHFARIFAGLVWTPQLADAAAMPVPDRRSFGTLADWAAARAAKRDADKALDAITAALWPEDD